MSLQILRSRASNNPSLRPHDSVARELVIPKLCEKTPFQLPLGPLLSHNGFFFFSVGVGGAKSIPQ